MISKVSESRSVVSDSLWPHELYSPWKSPCRTLEWVAFPFSSGSSQPRNRTRVSYIAGGFFTSWATRETQPFIRRMIPSEGVWFPYDKAKVRTTCSYSERLFEMRTSPLPLLVSISPPSWTLFPSRGLAISGFPWLWRGPSMPPSPIPFHTAMCRIQASDSTPSSHPSCPTVPSPLGWPCSLAIFGDNSLIWWTNLSQGGWE